MKPASHAVVVLLLLLLIPFGHAGAQDAIDIEQLDVLDLESANRIALAHNPSLAAAAARVEAAVEQVNQARSAYYPRLDAQAAASRVNLAENDYQASLLQARALNPAATIDDPETYFQTGLTASWVVFDGFARKFTNLRAQYGAEESRAAREDAQRLLLAAVAEAYYGVQLARENIAIAKADEGFNRRLMQEARVRREIGTGALSDVLNFEVQVNAARAAVITARQQQDAALAGLAALMGVAPNAFPAHLELAFLATESDQDMQPPDPIATQEYAAEHRPDLSRSAIGMQRAEAEIGAARAGYLPQVTLSATLDGDRSDDAGFERHDFGDTIALSVTYNLFSGGYTRARVSEARQNRLAVAKTLENQRLNVAAEVSRALTALIAAQDQLRLQRQNARLVQRNRELVEREYAAGQTSLVRLNEAQRDLVLAQGRLALARVSLYQARSELDAATGRNLDAVHR